MKSILHTGFVLLAVGLALTPTLALATTDVGRMLDQLDRLVRLTGAQKAQATAVFGAENDALDAFTSPDDRAIKGFAIRQNARAQIRALLTVDQQRVFDRVPQRLGGGAVQDPVARTERMDKVVGLTAAQTLQVSAILQQETDALQALALADRACEGAAIRRNSRTQIRALLTPEQQQKFDANPNGAEDHAEKAFVSAFVKSSPAIAARFGQITRLAPAKSTFVAVNVNGASGLTKGQCTYTVHGSTASGTIRVNWEHPAPNAPITIVRVEGADGATIQP